jgi:hypothetical protein
MSYKAWERDDDFNTAFSDNRMSVRTFGAKFEDQNRQSIGLADPLILDSSRFIKDSRYTPTTKQEQDGLQKQFKIESNRRRNLVQFEPGPGGSVKAVGAYWQNRAIDSAVFANPANFATRDNKYDWGLHDLSASLLNSKLSIFEQIHVSEEGAHFSFVPLAQPEDQSVIYTLVRMAKIMRPYWPEMYALIREYRAKMTRVKLAQNFDMGTGYMAIPVKNPGPRDRKFKLRYGLVEEVTVPKDVHGSGVLKVTPEVYEGRQQAARNYRSILDRTGKNEIMIALRQHNGPFPVYAQRRDKTLLCYDIVGGSPVPNQHQISENGVMT